MMMMMPYHENENDARQAKTGDPSRQREKRVVCMYANGEASVVNSKVRETTKL